MAKQSPFDLEQLYQNYLQLGKVSESKMHPVQRVETKRAFYGGCTQLLIVMKDELSKLSDDEGVEALEGMLRQTKVFWNGQTNNYSKDGGSS